MRQAGKIVANILGIMAREVRAGMTTKEFDTIARQELEKAGATSSFLDYRGYPATVCVSVNDEIVHGIPGNRVLKEGDLVSLDFGAIYNGYHGDAAVTVGVGKVTDQARKLMEAGEGALAAGISAARAKAHLGDVSHAIQAYAESKGYSVVREYTGHGIGKAMHEDPLVHNFGEPGTGPVLKKGMTFALEPMLNAGGWRTRVAEDRWTVLTEDGSLSVHYEHTIAITGGEAEVLTRRVYA